MIQLQLDQVTLFSLMGAFGLASFLVLSQEVADKDVLGATAFIGALISYSNLIWATLLRYLFFRRPDWTGHVDCSD